jgi:chemotaxis protein CheX
MVRRLILKERLDSVAAAALRGELAEAEGGPVALDASGVAFLGGLCLELLMCARQVWSAAGHAFTVETPSEAFSENLTRFGLTPETFSAGDPA